MESSTFSEIDKAKDWILHDYLATGEWQNAPAAACATAEVTSETTARRALRELVRDGKVDEYDRANPKRYRVCAVKPAPDAEAWVKARLADGPVGPGYVLREEAVRAGQDEGAVNRALEALESAGVIETDQAPAQDGYGDKTRRLADQTEAPIPQDALEYAVSIACRAEADFGRANAAGLVRVGDVVHVVVERDRQSAYLSELHSQVEQLATRLAVPLKLAPASAVAAAGLSTLLHDVLRGLSGDEPFWQPRLGVAPELLAFDEAAYDNTSPFRAELERRLTPLGLTLAEAVA